MAALQKSLASLGARNPIARSGTRHIALGVRAARCTLLFSTRSAWLAALLCASRVAALDVAPLIAKRARFLTVTGSSAGMPAVGVVTAARLTAFAMIFLRDICTFACATIATFVLASMTTGLQ
jgi:hypothetical protein